MVSMQFCNYYKENVNIFSIKQFHMFDSLEIDFFLLIILEVFNNLQKK